MLHKTSDCFESMDLTTVYNSSNRSLQYIYPLDITSAGYFGSSWRLAPIRISSWELFEGSFFTIEERAGRMSSSFKVRKREACYLPKILPAVYSVQ